MNKAFASEMILTIGVLIAAGILLLQLKSVFYGQTKVSQEEVASAFVNDIENIVDGSVAVTGNANFVYYPTIKSYALTVKNDTVSVYDKISKNTASFTKTSVNLQDMIFEDSDTVYITKVEDNVYIFGKCKEKDESCSDSVMCCHDANYCWGSSFVCHDSCAQIGEYAADDQACCYGLFLNTSTGKCDELPCNNDHICDYPQECVDCPDCSGPNPNCINDHICAPAIGENCVNSTDDCKCSDLGMGDCCPSCQESDRNSGCCPSSNVVDKNHCCPSNKPKWCENPNPGFSLGCKDDVQYQHECKMKTFTLIVIPVNWNDLSNFKTIAEGNADWFIGLAFDSCPDVVKKVIVDSRSCNSVDTSIIYNCAVNWGLIPSDDPHGYNWRLVGLSDDWDLGLGWGGYVSCSSGNLDDPLCKVSWSTTAWGRDMGREDSTPPFPHELGHTFGLCGEYCGSGDCDGPLYSCSDPIKCPIHCSEINKPLSNPTDTNCVMHNIGAVYYHPPCEDWLNNKGLPNSINYYCGV
ncbi:MAG: hypothetical protein NTW30_00165 [Candidatus Aenigmarchaeota archaeon]|nr:hypothetical protein [Candidatus Aenigmarchaeota archaeon]